MSKENGTLVYRWIIGLMITVIGVFTYSAYVKLDMVYEYVTANKYVIHKILDKETIEKVEIHEMQLVQLKADINDLKVQNAKTFVESLDRIMNERP